MDGSNTKYYLRRGTPLDDYLADYGLLVKREDLSCPPPGPPFSKTRGVFERALWARNEGFTTLGVLDTYHSQGGQAVAHAAQALGMKCLDFYPVYKGDEGKPVRPVQAACEALGAELVGLPAGRSAILFHRAKRMTEQRGGYMYPNALKLHETITATAAEVGLTFQTASGPHWVMMKSLPWIVSCSSATIAAGVIRGLKEFGGSRPRVILHMGYSRSRDAVWRYLAQQLGWSNWAEGDDLIHVDEGYNYKDVARAGPTPPWPCNAHYDLKAFRWWMAKGRETWGEAVLWNVG